MASAAVAAARPLRGPCDEARPVRIAVFTNDEDRDDGSSYAREVAAVSNGARFEAALENAERFFLGDAHVQRAMHELARNLEAAGIPYAIAGAMALNEYGYERVTKD